MTFCEKADMQKMMTVLQFWLVLLIQGSRKWVPKIGERGILKKDTQMMEKMCLGVPFGRLLGLFLATFLHIGFWSKTGHL